MTRQNLRARWFQPLARKNRRPPHEIFVPASSSLRRTIPRIHADGDRAVVDQTDLHVSPKDAAANRFPCLPFKSQAELFITLPGYAGSGRANKRGTVAFPG